MTQVLTNSADNVTATSYVVYALDGNDIVFAGQMDTDLYGGEGNDFLAQSYNGYRGDAYGGDGADTMHGGTISDRLYGGEGYDLLVGGEFLYSDFSVSGLITQFDGATGNDYLDGGRGTDAMWGLDGNDYLYGGMGNDTNSIMISVPDHNGTLRATAGGLYGGSGNDYLDGGFGHDYLDGGADNDTLYGGSGNDLLVGGSGTDIMYGGEGNDTYEVTETTDRVGEAAGGGWDNVFAHVDYTIPSDIEHLSMTGTAVWGTGNDTDNGFQGNDLDNRIVAWSGNDFITGNGGNDVAIFLRVDGDLGYNTFVDFDQNGDDAIAFDSHYFGTASAALAACTQVGSDVWIGHSANNVVVLANTDLATVGLDDFIIL